MTTWKILEINKPILETEKIIPIQNNKSHWEQPKKLLLLHFTEAKDENKEMVIENISIIDIEGNEYGVDYYKSSSPYPKLALNVLLAFSFKDIQDEPLLIKLFRFK